MVTQEELKNHFEYKEGHLYWKVRTSYASLIDGNPAGYYSKESGYVFIRFNKKLYREHRLIWLYHYGTVPKMIDHKNRVRDDNRIENLRETNDTTNTYNSKIRKDNLCGFRGIYLKKGGRVKPWIARINVNKKHVNLGYFITKEEAAKAYNEAAKKYFGEFANLNVV